MNGHHPGVYVTLFVAWCAWFSAFVLRRRRPAKAQHVDRRARWGIVLEGIAFALVWQGRFWERQLQSWRVALAILFFALACLLSWTAVQALGRQWRVDAGLNADHELVRSGPYAVVRHPIYTSMLCMLLGTGLMMTPWLLLAVALAVFICGTEIRVRTEDRLLASRFGKEFNEYSLRVSAYIPWLRG